MTTIVHAGRLIDGTGRPPVHDCAIRIDDGSVIEIGPAADLLARAPGDAEIIDASTSTVIPGLIDAHVHVTCPPAPSGYIPVEQQGSDAERYDRGVAALGEALRAGVVVQRDCGCPDLLSLLLRDAVRRGEVIGPRLVACGPAITTTAGHGHWIGRTADSDVEVRKRVRQLCLEGADFVKLMASGGDMTPRSNRRAPQFSDAEFDAAVRDAHRLGMPVVAHCNATEAMRQAAEFGADTVAHCNWLGELDGTIRYENAIADVFLAKGTFLDLNIGGTLNPYTHGDGWAMSQDFGFANRWELHGDLRRRGARLMLTSDEFGHQTADFPGLLGRFMAETGVPAVEVIYRSTLVPAMALGMADDTGSLEPGKRADLLVLDGDLVHQPEALTSPLHVFVNGSPIQEWK